VGLVLKQFVCVWMKVADMQDQLVCHGCRNLLMYPRGASNVRCALCNTINMVPPPPPPHGIDFFVEFELRMRLICSAIVL